MCHGPNKISIFHIVFYYLLLWPSLIHTSSFIKPGTLHLTKHHSSWSHKWFQWLWLQDKVISIKLTQLAKRWEQHVCKLKNTNFYLSCNATGSCILSISNFPAKWCKQKSSVSKAETLHELQLHQHISESFQWGTCC